MAELAFSKPVVKASLPCRVNWHRWEKLTTLSGMGKRGMSQRRGCPGCGKVEVYFCSWAVGSYAGWSHWGYLDPADFGMGLNELVRKYVPDHPSLKLEKTMTVTLTERQLAVLADVFSGWEDGDMTLRGHLSYSDVDSTTDALGLPRCAKMHAESERLTKLARQWREAQA